MEAKIEQGWNRKVVSHLKLTLKKELCVSIVGP